MGMPDKLNSGSIYHISLITCRGVYLPTEFVDLAVIRGQCLFTISHVHMQWVMGQHSFDTFAYRIVSQGSDHATWHLFEGGCLLFMQSSLPPACNEAGIYTNVFAGIYSRKYCTFSLLFQGESPQNSFFIVITTTTNTIPASTLGYQSSLEILLAPSVNDHHTPKC